jgi:hypothetical protein
MIFANIKKRAMIIGSASENAGTATSSRYSSKRNFAIDSYDR